MSSPTASDVAANAPPGQTPRLGFTVTKKVGGAPERNRIRRRLREAARIAAPGAARSGQDYVIVAKREVLSRPFADLVQDLRRAFDGANAALAKFQARKPETAGADAHKRRQRSSSPSTHAAAQRPSEDDQAVRS